jgi:hypothetical protein
MPRITSLLLVFATTTVLPAADPAPAAPAGELPPPALTEIWTPVPPVVAAPAGQPPSDAIVLFAGRNLDAWESTDHPGRPAPWRLDPDALVPLPKTGNIQTKAVFGDLQLHLEFRINQGVHGTNQLRGNSGVFFMGLYELQVLDSFNNPTYVNGQAASIYKQHAPLVNAARPPGEWQTYDVVWIAPRFAPDGRLLSPARLTAFHNGVLVQHDAVLRGPTVYRGTPAYRAHAPKLPLMLQEHTNDAQDAIAYRNIWVRELSLPASSD